MNGNAIVIDNGTSKTRVGLGGFDQPIDVFPSIVGRPKQYFLLDQIYNVYVGDNAYARSCVLSLTWPKKDGIVTNWDDMERIWQQSFNSISNCNPSEHSLVLTESIFNTRPNREKAAQIIFETFNIPCYYSNSQEFFSLIASCRRSGLVCCIGEESYQTASFSQYTFISNSLNTTKIGGKTLTNWLNKMLSERGHEFKTFADLEMVREMKEEKCYVSFDYDNDQNKDTNSVYRSRYGNYIELHNEVFKCPELLFQPQLNDIEYDGIDKTIVNSIRRCDSDLKSALFSNIIVSGGSSMFNGLIERLVKEIKRIAPNETNVNVIGMSESNNSPWLGGSIFSSLDCFPNYVFTRDEYNEHGSGYVQHKFQN